jgi:flagellar capping protein FliD
LSLNGTAHSLTVTDNSADSIVKAIKAQYGNQVTATKVNVAGNNATPDWRISLQGVQLGDLDPQILEDGTSIMDPAAKVTGAPAQYKIANSNKLVTSNSRTITVATGVTANILAPTGTDAGDTGTVTVTVSRPASALSNALSAFATSYNAAVDALAKQRGQQGGALAGNQIVYQLSQVLQNIGTYGADGGTLSLKQMGLDLGSDGHFMFDSSAFSQIYAQNAAGVAAFFGSPDTTGPGTGSGFLQRATNILTSVEDTDNGLLATAETSVKNQITTITNQINTQQDRVNQLQTQLTQQMAAADSAISAMTQQYTYITNMFQAMQTAAQQYK